MQRPCSPEARGAVTQYATLSICGPLETHYWPALSSSTALRSACAALGSAGGPRVGSGEQPEVIFLCTEIATSVLFDSDEDM